ncbi:hypothetical protein [Engelhardtia mirabilis]|uniref:Uncharacterized protein n=1 Tax=Engelhardtia mirabilis TaxID=2528011 RepID=A0A518BDT1_9BACT|nr:hypothetical protein Pla133_02090 [Planctomycetes bacterium Pla133]QDU99471.1 hypothetical protein Pla86_02090 [Planctomycetes bacterium Pla86]
MGVLVVGAAVALWLASRGSDVEGGQEASLPTAGVAQIEDPLYSAEVVAEQEPATTIAPVGGAQTMTLGEVFGPDFDRYAQKLAESVEEVTRETRVEVWYEAPERTLSQGVAEFEERQRATLFAEKANLKPDEPIDGEWALRIAGLRGVDPEDVDPGALSEALALAPILNDAIRGAVDSYCDTVRYHLENESRGDNAGPSRGESNAELMGIEGDESVSGWESALSRAGTMGGRWFYGRYVNVADDPLLEGADLAVRNALDSRRDTLRAILDLDGH